MATHRRCYGKGVGVKNWGHFSQPRCPMIPAKHRRCYGTPFPSQVSHVTGHTGGTMWGRGWRLGTASQASRLMLPATHRRCYGGRRWRSGTHFPSQLSHDTSHTQAVLWGGGGLGLGKPFPSQTPRDTGHKQAVLLARGVKIGDTFRNPGVPWYWPHRGGAMGRGGLGKNWGHLSQPRPPMVLATNRRCYWGGGVKIGEIFPKPGAPWYRPHTGGAMGHLFQARFSVLPATHRCCYVGEEVKIRDTFPKPGVPWYRPHTVGGMGGVVKIGDTFPKSGVPWYRPHTGSAKWGGGGGRRLGTPFRRQAPHDTGQTQAVLWETFLKPGSPCYRPHTGGAISAGGEDWGHLSQPRCPMILATQRRCYGEGGLGKNWGHLSQPWPPMVLATNRRCYWGGGLRLRRSFQNQVPHDTGHTQAVLWDTFSKPGSPCYRPHTGAAMWGRRWRLGTPFPSQASHDTGHTQSVVWGEWWRLGTLFLSQASHDTGHTQAVLNRGGGGGVNIGDTFPKTGAPWYRPNTGGAMGNLSEARFPMLPATHRRCYWRGGWRLGTPFATQVFHDTGHTEAVLWGGGIG